MAKMHTQRKPSGRSSKGLKPPFFSSTRSQTRATGKGSGTSHKGQLK